MNVSLIQCPLRYPFNITITKYTKSQTTPQENQTKPNTPTIQNNNQNTITQIRTPQSTKNC